MKHKSFKAFTIIELLIVISLMGVLSGVLITVLNPTTQRNKAKDSVVIANIEKISQGIQAYYASEGTYPDDSTGNPLTGQDEKLSSAYIHTWPSDTIYTYAMSSDGKNFVVYAPFFSNTRLYAKYYSTWDSVKSCSIIDASDECGSRDPRPVCAKAIEPDCPNGTALCTFDGWVCR